MGLHYCVAAGVVYLKADPGDIDKYAIMINILTA